MDYDPKKDADTLALELAGILYDEVATEAVGGKTQTVAKMQVMLAEVFTTMATGFTAGAQKAVSGYTAQPDAKVALVNSFKEDEERLLRKVENLIDTSEYEVRGPLGDSIKNRYDTRWAAVARTHFQEGFMALNRAVFQPQRIKLPEDGE